MLCYVCMYVCMHACARAHVCVCVCVCVHAQPLSRVRLFGTMAHQAPLSMGFSKQEYLSGLPLGKPHSLHILMYSASDFIPISIINLYWTKISSFNVLCFS